MNYTIRDAVLTAVSYADIFDYPLTEEELGLWLPFLKLKRSHPVERQQGETLQRLKLGHSTYYSLRPVRRMHAVRQRRALWSIKKWSRARRVAWFLRCIPSVSLVGVTGGLARSNANEQDDIDFFILCSPKTVWITRALTTILLDIFHLRRRPKDENVKNLICLNMFMSEDGLALPAREHDLFSAHEVLLMTPLWERDGTYKKFLFANRWVKKFLPNAWEEKSQSTNPNVQRGKRFYKKPLSMLAIVIWSLRFIEPLFRNVQLWYMSKRRSTEIVTDNVIRFHPQDARGWIKRKLGVRLARYNIPLDKIFYAR